MEKEGDRQTVWNVACNNDDDERGVQCSKAVQLRLVAHTRLHITTAAQANWPKATHSYSHSNRNFARSNSNRPM